MFAAISAFLKKAALKAASVAKTAVKGAVAHPVKTLVGATPAGQLYNAFANAGQGQGQGGEAQQPTAKPEAQATPVGSSGGAGQGIGAIIGQSGVGVGQQQVQTMPKASIIPAQYQPFVRQGGMQYAPGPEGSVVGGQGGDVMQGYGMKNPQSKIPQAYMNMANAGQQGQQPTQRPDVGFIRGMINGLTSQPQPEGIGDVSQGRRTAYYSGGIIPNIIMSKLGQPSSAEATAQQQQIESSRTLQEARNEQKTSPSYQSDLQSAIKIVTEKGASDEEKTYMYQKLASKYPKQSSELKRIFFPQAQDGWADTLGNIMAGSAMR